MSEALQKEIVQEAELMASLDHPNVLKIVDIFEDSFSIFII